MKISFNNYLKNFDGILISSVANITYLIGNFGFSLTERECLILITKHKKYVITDGRYSEAVKSVIKGFSVIDSGANQFLGKTSKDIFKDNKIKTLGFEENNLTFAEYKAIKKFVKLKPVNLDDFRIRKNKKELRNIKLACKIGDDAFEFIVKKIKKGKTEKQIEEELINFIKSRGADISFNPIIAYGKNSSIPHHQNGKNMLNNNQIVLLDFGVKVNNYCSDMTRTIFLGKATDKFKKIHKTVLDSQTKAIQFINSQLSIVNGQLLAKDVDKIARDYIIEQGFPNITHSVGHGIGIEVHESPYLSPNSRDKLGEGMVFSVEPGIYITGYGGVRIEDLVLITKNGAELISLANREIIEI